MFYIFGFYKFKKLTRLLSFKKEFNSILKNNSARGSIIISTEGLNGIISGEKKDILKIIHRIKTFYNFKYCDSQY
jgi:predicted sulfurtransferase